MIATQPIAPVVDQQPRCWRCGRMLAYFLARPWKLTCGRCKAENASQNA